MTDEKTIKRNKKDPVAAKKRRETLKRVLGMVFENKLLAALLIVLCIVNIVANLIGTYMLAPLIDDYIEPLLHMPTPDYAPLVKYLIEMLAIYAVGVVANYLTNRILVDMYVKIVFDIRKKMFANLQTFPVQFFDTHTHGELMSRFTNDVDTITNMISQGVPQVINCVLNIVGIFIMMLITSPLLTLIVVASLLIMLFVVSRIGGKSRKYFARRQKQIGKVNGFVEEHIEGQKVVKVFCHEAEEKASFDEINTALMQSDASAQTYAGVLMPMMGNLSYITFAITAAVGGLLALSGGITPGKIVAFLRYCRQFSMPISQVSQVMNSIIMGLAGAERVFEIIDGKPEVNDGAVTLVNVTKDGNGNLTESADKTGDWAWKKPTEEGKNEYVPLRGDVRFNKVFFGYNEDKCVLHGIDLFAKPGQKIAFVGSTGAGKTTITNLINRFYDIQEGTITYDGIPIKDIRKESLRHSLGLVLQDTHLFTGTVMDNIKYGADDISDEQAINASKLANAHGFIMHLPDGYNTMLTADGENLSQGQRQLLNIARAAASNPPVLILDEATSSIDTRTEKLIEEGMDTLMQGRTVFVIAHRLSTVRNSNCILVLENGEVIERGSHDELLAEKGKYYSLYTGMFELS